MFKSPLDIMKITFLLFGYLPLLPLVNYVTCISIFLLCWIYKRGTLHRSASPSHHYIADVGIGIQLTCRLSRRAQLALETRSESGFTNPTFTELYQSIPDSLVETGL